MVFRRVSQTRPGWAAPARGAAGQGGFTLLEVLIAITVTAVIGVGVWALLSSVIGAKTGIDRVSDEFSRLQRTIIILERDLGQIVFRPIRDIYGDSLAAVTTRTEPWSIEFTRDGWRNPLGHARSNLQRVAYEVVDEELHRNYWQVLDRAQDSEPREQVLIDGVLSLEWRFLDANREWQMNWPSDTQLQGLPVGAGDQVPLPLAVEMVLEHRRFGRIRRLIDLGQFNRDKAALQTPGATGGTGGDEGTGQDGQDTRNGQDNGQSSLPGAGQ